MSDNLKSVPVTLKAAKEFVARHHRHHPPPQGHKFSIACSVRTEIVGVLIAGRPVSRNLDNGKTLEVTRCCTDGYKNACSFLYSRAARIAKELGYNKIITYILESESGTTLKASGWFCENSSCGGSTWNRPSRKRDTDAPTCKKKRFAKIL